MTSMGVSTASGQTVDTNSPCGASSVAAHREKARTANFVALYTEIPGMGAKAAMDATLMMWPRPRGIMCAAASRVPWMTPLMFTSIWRSTSSALVPFLL